MRLLRTFAELPAKANLAIGVFDGVHLGHQRVISEARAAGGTAVALTFDPHPIRTLRPDQAPLLLTSTEHKLALFRHLGLDACLLVKFDKAFSETPAERFIEQISTCRQVCVGTRFHFGHGRTGNVALMEKLAPRYGFTVKEIQSVHTPAGEMISSTAVRKHLLAGNLDRAAAMLGRQFSILGTVEHGDHRGHELGFPTANLNPRNEVLPPDGVYAVRVRLADATLTGVVNIGVRPTFAGTARRLEVHILDFDQGLYGQEIEVEFVRHLRPEQKFASVAELKAQIALDVQAARLFH
ncbi:MAG: bifunctional riboflavin kinase/FAD synthetase [Verrucomicrobiota bacterium]